MSARTAALMVLAAAILVQARPPVSPTHHIQTYDRLRRDISLHGQTVNQLDRQRLLQLIARVDLSRCFAKWACDILAREETDRASEERDLAELFTDVELKAAPESPDSPQSVYLAAAARGRASGGNRSVCEVPSCRAQPQDMLKMLREIEGFGDLVREAGKRQRQSPPLVVFGVEEGRPVLGQGGQSVLFEVVEGVVEDEKSQEEGKEETEERSQEEGKEETGEKSQKKDKEELEVQDVGDEDKPAKDETEMPAEDQMSSDSRSSAAAKENSAKGKETENEVVPAMAKMESKINGNNINVTEYNTEDDDSNSDDLPSAPAPK